MRTDLTNILKLIRLIFKMSVIQNMLHPIIKPPHQDLKILTQGDILFFNNIQNGLGKVVLVLHVIVEDGVVKGQLD
jgi:hypothetical protein